MCREPIKDRRVVPIMCRLGVKHVLFNLFNPPANNIIINRNRDAWTIDVLVREIRAYPDSTQLMLKSKVKGGIQPDTIKRIVFCLLLKGVLHLSYDDSEKRSVFNLKHSTSNDSVFALDDDECWESLDLKP